MTSQFYLTIAIMIAITSCESTENAIKEKQIDRNEELLIVGDIDTANLISQLKIMECASNLQLSNEKIDNLSDQLDTLELTYYFGFCDCQRWIKSEIHRKALQEDSEIDLNDSREQVEFNLDNHGYYIEAANKELTINWRTGVNGTTIRFIGREYIDKRLPKDGAFTIPDPPKGKVFRYYSYQILHPYQVWGPHKLVEIDTLTGDSITEPVILTVK